MPRTAVSKIVIGTASDHPRELRTATELRALLVTHDVSGLQWTSRVTIDHHAVAHSHPVLVLDTRCQGDPLLATYVHQQLHWWIATHPGLRNAIADTQQTWATVPTANGGGADSQGQTRVELIVCHLERRAMHHIIGDTRSRLLLRDQIGTGKVHPWVYAQIHIHARRLDHICTTWDLWPPRLQPDHPPTTR